MNGTEGEKAGRGGEHQVFYRYQDDTGRVVIVDSRDHLPAHVRDRAERIELDGTPQNLVSLAGASGQTEVGAFHAPSFLLGVGAALLVATLLFSFRRGGSGTIARLLGGATLLAVLAGAYFGWLRRTSGQSDSLVSSPTELVDDARRAVEKVEERRREEARTLDEIERQTK